VQKERKDRRRPGAIDAMVMQCAVAWEADAIVTGDPDDIAAFGKSIRILRL
jgi:hypothetical protein